MIEMVELEYRVFILEMVLKKIASKAPDILTNDDFQLAKEEARSIILKRYPHMKKLLEKEPKHDQE